MDSNDTTAAVSEQGAALTARGNNAGNREPGSSGKRRQYLPAEERRRRILESSREVFARVGLKGARTRELARAAGINQATLFEHFRSKEELFAAAVIEPLEALMEDARSRAESYAAADSPGTLLDLLQTGIEKNLESMVAIYPLLVQGLFGDQAIGEKLYREHLLPMLKTRSGTMQQFVRSPLDPELVQLASFGMFFAMAMDGAMTGAKPDLTDIARQLAELVTFGAASGDYGEI